MGMIFVDPSESGSVASALDPGDVTASTAQTAGVWSAYSMRINSSSEGTFLWQSAENEFWGQARIRLHDGYSTAKRLKFKSPNNVVNVEIQPQSGSTGRLEVYRGDGTTLLGATTMMLQLLRWYYLQFHFTIHDSTGVVDLRIDGSTELALTGQDTRADAAAGGDTCDRCALDTAAANEWFVDDWIINDAADTDNTSYPDNLGVEAIMPTAAGDSTQLQRGGTDSGANWSQVEERPSNDATDYVFDSVVNDYDLYNLATTQMSTVAAVAVILRAQKSDAGAASIAHMLKVDTDASGTADTEDQGADVALATSWAEHVKYYNRQPGPSSWSAAKVDALQAGAKVR